MQFQSPVESLYIDCSITFAIRRVSTHVYQGLKITSHIVREPYNIFKKRKLQMMNLNFNRIERFIFTLLLNACHDYFRLEREWGGYMRKCYDNFIFIIYGLKILRKYQLKNLIFPIYYIDPLRNSLTEYRFICSGLFSLATYISLHHRQKNVWHQT